MQQLAAGRVQGTGEVRTGGRGTRDGTYGELCRSFGKWRELIRRSLPLLAIAGAAPLVLLVVVLRPVVLLRFGTMRSDRIGHFILDAEAYLCARDREMGSLRTVDLIGCPQPLCNTHVLSLWKSTFRVWPGWSYWKHLDTACRFWT
jgi:hypothetical protein